VVQSDLVLGIECPPIIRDHLADSGARVLDVSSGAVGTPTLSGDRLLLPAVPSVDGALDLLRRGGLVDRIRGVVAVSDRHLDLAARFTEAFGTPGVTRRCVRLAADKVAMRGRLAESGMSPVRWEAVHDAADLVAFARELGGPMIVKPAAGSGSRRILRIDGPSSRAIAEFVDQRHRESGWIAEEFLTGPEVSVEAFSWRGRHQVLGITAKRKGAHFVEMGHVFPADLPGPVCDAVSALVVRALSALEIDCAVSHSEVMLTAEGPRLVETHPRVGGDRIGRLVELVTGLHPVARLAGSLVGRPVADRHDAAAVALVQFFTVPPGVVTAVEGIGAAAAVDGVRDVVVDVRVGDEVGEVRSSDDRAGHVVVTGDTVARAEAAAARALAEISVAVEPIGAGTAG
jgi:biotin carboxylase